MKKINSILWVVLLAVSSAYLGIVVTVSAIGGIEVIGGRYGEALASALVFLSASILIKEATNK